MSDTGNSTTPSTTSASGTTTGESTTTGSTTAEGSTSSASEASASVGFLYGLPDMGAVDPIECSLFAQDCLDDQKCAAWANDGGEILNATKCVPLDPDPHGVGDVCTFEGALQSGVDSCDPDSRCLGEAGGIVNEGTCVALCSGTPERPLCSDPDLECVFTEMDVLPVCIAPCACEGKSSCVALLDGTGECVPAP